MITTATISLLLILVFLLHKYAARNYDYWKKRHVPFIKPKPFVGNFLEVCLFKLHVGEHLANLHNSVKVETPCVGIFIFDQPALLLKDPEVIKNITTKEFSSFVDRMVLKADYEPEIAHMLFHEKGEDWRIMRNKIKPVFSSLKMKQMFENINNVAVTMVDYMEKKCEEGGLDAKELSGRYATDVISKCAYAFTSNSFGDTKNEFQKIEEQIFQSAFLNILSIYSHFFFHSVSKLFKLRFFDRTAVDYLRVIFWESIKYREEHKWEGNDILDVIMELRKDEEFCERMNFHGDKVIAPALMFFVAGSETLSATLSFVLYELALNPEIQKKLRMEIERSLKDRGGKITYEVVTEIDYLTMVINETLRKHPVFPFVDRVCNEKYKIPGTDIIIEPGIPVIISMIGFHRDPNYYNNPDVFDPERFRGEHKNNYTFLPFGKGPRACIGERFGYLAVKLGLIQILRRFEILEDDQTPHLLRYEAKSILLASKTGLPLRFKKIETILKRNET